MNGHQRDPEPAREAERMAIPGHSSDEAQGRTEPQKGDDAPTLAAVGVAVAIAASLAHEALGHGLGCVADGGRITLLTFLVFRCAGAGVLADAGGPAGAFIVAAACLTALRRLRPKASVANLLVYGLGVQTSLWMFAQLVREGLDGSDDWGHVASDLGWIPAWHVAAVAIGVVGYVTSIRLATRPGIKLARGRPSRLAVPYLVSCLSAVGFAALWHGDRAASALDAALTFGAAPLGYLLVIGAAARNDALPTLAPIGRDRAWIAGVFVVGLLFAATIARGVGRSV